MREYSLEHNRAPALNEFGELTEFNNGRILLHEFTFNRSNPIIFHDLDDMISDKAGALRTAVDPEFRGVVLVPFNPESGKVAAIVKQVGLGTFAGVQLSGSKSDGYAPIEGTEQLFTNGQVIGGTAEGTHRGLVVVADSLESGLESLADVSGAERVVNIARASKEPLAQLSLQARARRFGRRILGR